MLKTARLARIALLTALLCVCSWITVPSVIPFTLQTFAVFCALLISGGRDGTLSVTVYLALGAVGLPVFSGFQGGVSRLVGPTGGYLLGFLLTGLFVWLLEPAVRRRPFLRVPVLAVGQALCYLCGTAWYAATCGTGFGAAFLLCVLPYLLPDAVKILLAAVVSARVRARIPG